MATPTEEPIVEPNLEETPVEEPINPTEEPKEPEEEPAPEETPEEQPEERPISRRESLRVQDLLNKYPTLSEKQPVQAPDFRKKIDADEEVYKNLEETTVDYGRSLLEEATNRANYNTWYRFLKSDDSVVSSKYAELDKGNKERFYPALANALSVKYLQSVGYNPGNPEKGIAPSVQNPDISYADFVEAEMEFANELASMKGLESQKNIAKQAAQTGIRPDGSSAKRLNLNQAPENMTDEELNAVIAQAIPNK